MHQQMNQNMNVPGTVSRPREPAYDETMYAVPDSGGQSRDGTWVYGDPELSYDGSRMGAAVGNAVISGAGPGGNQRSSPETCS